MTPPIEVVSLSELRLSKGVCDGCKYDGWVILIIVGAVDPHAVYVCDTCRRDLIEKLVAA